MKTTNTDGCPYPLTDLLRQRFKRARPVTPASRLADALREYAWAIGPATLAALDRADRWLCCHLRPLGLRRFWRELWIRTDEFHPSLDLDPELIARAQKEPHRWRNAIARMERRRRLAHELARWAA